MRKDQSSTSDYKDATIHSSDEASGHPEQEWTRCLAGDVDAFEKLVSPYLEELFAAAQRDVRYHIALDDIHPEDITPEELVGETLLRAWRDRHHCPSYLAFRPWLLGLQFRVITRIIRQEQLLGRFVSISLDAPVPPDPVYDDDEGFLEWFQPDETARWEDVLPIAEGESEVAAQALEEAVPNLSPIARQVFIFRQVNGLSLADISAGLRISPQRVRELWKEAVTSLLDAIEE